jgi:hypothetical protein
VAQALTSTLLLHDFNLKVEMPSSNDLFLCPPVPNRVNYVCWISDLVNANIRRDKCVSGIKRVGDIGVGPIAIYPLLGTALFHMEFIGSDVNALAVEHAKNIIKINQLERKIELFLVDNTDQYQSLLREHLTPLSIIDSQKSTVDVKLTSLIVDVSGRVRRGPLLMLLTEYCASEASACEERFLTAIGSSRDGITHFGEDRSLPTLLDAVMVNPPFYTLDEEVRA